jgi:hypothetical protein
MNSYKNLLDQLFNISSGNINSFDDTIQYNQILLNDYKIYTKSIKDIKYDSYIKLFSYYLYNNKNRYNVINILNIIKINKNVQMNIYKLLSLCEKWRFGDLYYLIKDIKISSETSLLNLEINYNNNIYIFDFKNIITYIQDKLYNNITINQLCLNYCEYTNLIPNNKYLILIESIYPYCPIIRFVSNPTTNDIILYETDFNPFIFGKKIRLNNKDFVYNNCLPGTIYQSEKINNMFYVCFNTYNNNCYFFITTSIFKNDLCTKSKFINELKSIEVDNKIFDYKKLKLQKYDDKYFQFVLNKNLLIGPSNINSIMCGKNILYDNMKYTLNKYKNIDDNDNDFLFYLKRLYNISNNSIINFESFKADILFEKNLFFIKQNKFFTCDEIKHISNISIFTPIWDNI